MKTIIITGAGTGIGAATAKALAADRETALILLGRRLEILESLRSELPNAEYHQCISADVSNLNSIKSALAETNLGEKNVVGLFANAGVGGENHYDADDRWDEIINTNLTGVYHCIMETLPFLLKSEEPFKNIVVTSSILARFGVPNHTAYCASKTGLLGLVKSLAVQHASNGLLVNAICPGWVETDMAKAGIQDLANRQETSYEEAYKTQMSFLPTGKMSQPEEIANLVKFLLTNQETSITGQALDINNGAFML